MKIINIGILAHVDAGKTTLTESLLYTSGAIAEQGNVDKGTTRTDTMILERQRGITIQTAVTSFCWNDYKINIVDTPGHMDFLTEAYRSLSVLDGAVLVISAKDGVQAQTRILFHALQKMDIPTIIFINKIDQNGIDLRRVYQSIKDKLTSDMIVMQEVSLSPKITMTDISDLDKWDMIISGSDELLERYVAEDSLDIQELQYEKCKRTRCCSLFPVYHGSAKDNLGTEKLIEAYEKENENVTVKIQLTPYKGGEYWTKLEASAGGGTAPDVFWLNVLHLDSYVEGGILGDLSDAIASSDIKDNFAETLVNNYVRDGKNYAVPKDFDTNALWYNKDLFDQAGVEYPTDDMTYDDLVALATELKDKLPDGVYPFACPVDFQTWYYQTVYANGGWILNDDATETGYGDAKTQEGIQCWIDMIDAGLSPSASTLSETGSDAMFEGEQIAMTLAGSYMVPEYASNDTIKDKIDCVEVPTFNGVEDNCINGLGFAVYEGSKQKEEAEKFAIWMGSSEAQKIQGETGVVISAREDAQQYFAKANEQYNLAAYTNHSAEAYPLPVCGKAAELYDMESTWLTKAYTGEMSLADACSGLKEEADALLAK